MGFVTDRNLLHYPDRIFTLFQEVGNIVEIACPCSIFTMSANLFYKTDVDKSFNCRVNCFPIHTTFFCYKPPGRKTGTGIIVAVPEQTAIYDKVPRLQPELKDSVGYHKKISFFWCNHPAPSPLCINICEGAAAESIRPKQKSEIYALWLPPLSIRTLESDL